MSWKARLSQVVCKLQFYVTPGKESIGPQAYLKNHYHELAQLNPGLEIVVRNVSPGEPEIRVTYGKKLSTLGH